MGGGGKRGLRGQTWGREPDGRTQGRLEVRGRLPGAARAAYSGDAPPRQEAGRPSSRGKRPPPGSQSRRRAVRDQRLSGLRSGEAAKGGGGPAASAAPSPGVSARDTPSPGPGRCRSRRAVTSPELRRGAQPPPAGRGRGRRRCSSAAGPGNRLELRRCSGTDTDPRGRHDGLRAAPQRGQAPPPAPPPAASGARLAGTGTLLAPFSRRRRTFRPCSPCPPEPAPAQPLK